MPSPRLEYLFDRYVHFACSKEEEQELMVLLTQPEHEALAKRLVDETLKNTGVEIRMPGEMAASMLENILQKKDALVVSINNRRGHATLWLRVAAAAVVVFVLVNYGLIEKKDDSKEMVARAIEKKVPIVPGGKRAMLTLSDGSTIVLDSMQNGILRHENTTINKQDDVLMYNKAISGPSTQITYNTLFTPRGGQYNVVLSDGSRVWLNAESSLHFPTAFTGSTREVELKGEAYFEVAKSARMPFNVKVDGMIVHVLGTHFNVKAYSDENTIKTSLLEGSVKIIRDDRFELLNPGRQAVLDKKQDNIEVAEADMSAVMAWKNGLFQFEGADIITIMREIGRWYNVEIVYAGKVPVHSFEGKISRNAELSDVLQILALSDVKFSVEGRKIIVQ
ncbi:MAG: FecR domain-containing protein [Chitinophagaceae bacterium]